MAHNATDFPADVLRAAGIDPSTVIGFTLTASVGEPTIIVATHIDMARSDRPPIERRWRVVEQFASGGIVDSDQLVLVGEDGVEIVKVAD